MLYPTNKFRIGLTIVTINVVIATDNVVIAKPWNFKQGN